MKRIAMCAMTALLLSLDTTRAAAGKYSYYANGADWPNMPGTECAKTNQSPIDLRSVDNSHPYYSASSKEATFSYENFRKAEVINMGKTVQVNIPEVDQEKNTFTTKHVPDVRGGGDKFTAVQFHFHSKSEHTIDGKRYDMEMHIVHLVNEEKGDPVTIKYSALGFMFDVDDYDQSITPDEVKTINGFFDSINLGNIPADGKAEKFVLDANATVPLGDFVNLMSDAGRWVYTGSLTTPPCTVGVFFQVYDRVLPISRKHLNLYLAHQRALQQDVVYTKAGEQKASPALGLEVTGNWRVTNKVDNHKVVYLRPDDNVWYKDDLNENATTMGILFALFMVLAIILAIVAFMMNKKIAALDGGSGGKAMMEGGALYNDRVELTKMDGLKINKVGVDV